jgi:hypothetical protein
MAACGGRELLPPEPALGGGQKSPPAAPNENTAPFARLPPPSTLLAPIWSWQTTLRLACVVTSVLPSPGAASATSRPTPPLLTARSLLKVFSLPTTTKPLPTLNSARLLSKRFSLPETSKPIVLPLLRVPQRWPFRKFRLPVTR